MTANREGPLIFACSGCSNAGATADRVARRLNATGFGEMSCLAGVAAKKKPFLKKLENRDVLVIDGCPIHCAASIFEELGPIKHVRLYEVGLKKHAPLPDDEAFSKLVKFAMNGGSISSVAGEGADNAPSHR